MTGENTSTAKVPVPPFEAFVGPSVNEICAWLASTPSLDTVAARLRFLRMVQAELGEVVSLMRQHVMTEIGERGIEHHIDVQDGVPF